MYKPQATDLSTGGTTKVSAGTGLSIYVVAVTNGETSVQTLTFADEPNTVLSVIVTLLPETAIVSDISTKSP